jgi:2-oxoglutarate ferredoxin oxidoreductase subunit delta
VVSDSINEHGLHPVKFREDAECDGCKKCAIMCPDVAIEIYN